MHKKLFSLHWIAFFLLLVFLSACKGKDKQPPVVSQIVSTPEELDQKATDIIRESLEFSAANNGDIGDSIFLFDSRLTQLIYERKEFHLLWSSEQQWKHWADSMLQFIEESKLYGLFPEDYHYPQLAAIYRRMRWDSLAKTDRRDAALWSKADLLLTDAFVHIIKDVKLGRLPNDSVSLRRDSILTDSFYLQQWDNMRSGTSLTQIAQLLEPVHKDYQLLKAGIKPFLDSADFRTLTKVPSSKDSILFKTILQKRLFEGGYIAFDSVAADSAQLAEAVKKFQKHSNITVDGKAGEGTIRMLNTSDRDRFVRIAISLDRHKLLPEKMPDRYLWVNLPAFTMRLQDGDSVKLVSKIICGKAKTRTPLLTSAISEIITYPQWTIPTSIIVKEILPAVKRNPGYLTRKGFSLIDDKGDEVDPYSVDWSKYSRGIPYKVVQGSGDDNALGVLKFNFPNKYAVYLHDTNQRYLFGQAVRSFSHGCVRVQEWQKLAAYIIRKDQPEMDDDIPMMDSLDTWLSKKEKHSIPVKKRLPVYIRYFTCEGKAGGIVFYDDIYGEDKKLQEKYFADR